MTARPREPKAGELREISILERMDRLSRRPESRMDLQRVLENLSDRGKKYARHLVTSGPSGYEGAAKALGLTAEEMGAAVQELESKIAKI